MRGGIETMRNFPPVSTPPTFSSIHRISFLIFPAILSPLLGNTTAYFFVLAFTRNMSRAFIKESDGDNVVNAFPERVHSDVPNYITRKGLERLQAKVRQLETELTALNTSPSIDKPSQIERIKQDLSYHRERLRRAIPTDTPSAPDAVQFGVTVILLGEDNDSYQFTLVGEDETDLETGRISWASPIARLLMGHKMGDEVHWNRGDEILKIEITGLHGIVQDDLTVRP